MTVRVALIDGRGLVANVAIFASEWNQPTWDGHKAVMLPNESAVEAGWSYTAGKFTAPPTLSLAAERATIAPTQTALVAFTDTYDAAPDQVTFTVNGATATVALTDGTAQLEVTPSGAGDITVSVDQPVDPITITVEG